MEKEVKIPNIPNAKTEHGGTLLDGYILHYYNFLFFLIYGKCNESKEEKRDSSSNLALAGKCLV